MPTDPVTPSVLKPKPGSSGIPIAFDPVTFAIQVVSSAGLGYINRRKQSKARKEANAVTGVPSQSAQPIPLVYGDMFVPAQAIPNTFSTGNNINDLVPLPTTRVFGSIASPDANRSREFLMQQYIVCQAGIDSIVGVKVDDKPLTDPTLVRQVWMQWDDTGTASTQATGFDSTTFPLTSKGEGLTKITLIARLDLKAGNFRGIPRVDLQVKGGKCVDVNADNTLNTTKTWTANPIRILLEFLLDSDYGPGIPMSGIDLAAYKGAIAMADRIVQGPGNSDYRRHPLPDLVTRGLEDIEHNILTMGEYLDRHKLTGTRTGVPESHGPVRRFEFNGMIDSTLEYEEIIGTILSVCPGVQRYINNLGQESLSYVDVLAEE